MIELRQSRPSDIKPIAQAMRAMDRVECEAFGHGPREALRLGYIAGDCLTVEIDGRPEAMLGVGTVNALESVGKPWMLASERVLKERRAWAEWGPAVVGLFAQGFRRLENYVHRDNAASIGWLERLGFTVEPEVVSVGAQPFRRFCLVRPG